MALPDRNAVRLPRASRSVNVIAGVSSLLVVHWLLAVSSIRQKSTTFDEIAHLAAGLSLWKTGDYRLLPDPPLPHLWAAAPVAAGGFTFPDLDRPYWWSSNHWRLGRKLFYECGNEPQALLIRGRAMIALLSAASGLLVYVCSRRLFGHAGGLLSLVLYVFSPTMLAHGRLITSDLAVALFFLAAMMALWSLMQRVSPLSFGLSVLALGGLLLSKMTGLFILPMAGILLAVRLISGRPVTLVWGKPFVVASRGKQAAVWLVVGLGHVLVIWLLLWAAYGFRFAAMRDAVPGRDRFYSGIPLVSGETNWGEKLTDLGTMGSAVAWMHDHRLLPEAYLVGMIVGFQSAQKRVAFLNGQASAEGWRSFFPYCFAVKTPLPLFGMLLLAAVAAIWRTGRGDGNAAVGRRWRSIVDGLYRTAPLWVLFCVYWAFAIASHLNIGHRHVLPVYLVVFVLAGAAAWLPAKRAAARLLVPGMAVLFVGASLKTWPDYLTFFNVLAGGPKHAYRHLVDSSLDWGQDLPRLKVWLDRHGRGRAPTDTAEATQAVYLSYFGSGSPTFYGIQARRLPGFLARDALWTGPLTGGVYCISATLLQQVHLLPECRWTHALESDYQDLRRRLNDAARPVASSSASARRPQFVAPAEADSDWFLKLRFARLCAYLRERSPTDDVGHTILIYRLDDADVNQALEGPPSELVSGCADNLRRLADLCFVDRCFASAAAYYEDLFRRIPVSSDPERIKAANRWAIALMSLGRQGRAIAVMRDALAHDAGHVGMNANLARLLATSGSKGLRDGEEALRRAKTALAGTGGTNATVLDALAAAYAELGQFEQACGHASEAARLAAENGQRALAHQIMAHLESYRRHQPWRQP